MQKGAENLLNLVRSGLTKTLQSNTSYLLEMITSYLSSVDPKSLPNIQMYLTNADVIRNVMGICFTNIKLILKDNQIDLSDAGYFIVAIQKIYSEVNSFNQKNVSLKITSDNLINICCLLLNIVLGLTIQDDTQLKKAISITTSSMELIKLTFSKTTWSCRPACCFGNGTVV